jgi:purine-binding chemotaxis protein CheW
MCALPIANVEETMRPLPIELLPGLPPFVLGLSMVRGTPIPVVDTGLLIAMAPTDLRAARFVTIRVGSHRASLAVDGVIGVRDLASASVQELPPLLHDARDLVEAIGATDAELLLVLQSARMVPESVWSALDVQSAAP